DAIGEGIVQLSFRPPEGQEQLAVSRCPGGRKTAHKIFGVCNRHLYHLHLLEVIGSGSHCWRLAGIGRGHLARHATGRQINERLLVPGRRVMAAVLRRRAPRAFGAASAMAASRVWLPSWHRALSRAWPRA